MKYRFPRWLALVSVLGLAACFTTDATHGDVAPQQWWEARGPVVPHDTFPEDCSVCHFSSGWNDIKDDFEFDHEAETGVRLDGAHAPAECLRCHNDRGPVQAFAARGCAGCHEDSHRGQLGNDCSDCHTEIDWNPVGSIAQHNETRFPLVGAHVATACFRCHEGAQVGSFSRADIQCATCHGDDLARAKVPDHLAQGWVADCDGCHSPTQWKGAGFSHAWFPLGGGHSGLGCKACHGDGVFVGTPAECASCHIDEYNATTNPDHAGNGFSTNCDECHSITAWPGGSFTHAHFPLVGAHAGASCGDCHGTGVFAGTASDCASCHIGEYNATKSPNHIASGFPTDCDQCHTPAGWKGATFEHDQFPLLGVHAATNCTECHIGGVFAGTASDCAACHLDEYNATTSPNHGQAGLPTDCASCHDPFGWPGGNFTHAQFPLQGAHAGAACNDCHGNGVFAGTASDCASCHLADYNATTSPNHLQTSFSTDCASCHNPFGWQGATFDHLAFPLLGAHAGAACSQCHSGGVYQGTPADCVSCHLADYNGTNNPNHVQAGFPTACDSCHDTFGWGGGVFDHFFDIKNGPHSDISCAKCHTVPGDFSQATCTQCHKKTKTGDKHKNVSGYSWSSPACINCHPKGKD